MNLDIKLKFNFNKSYGLLCNIVVLKVVKDEEMRHN